MNEAIAYNRSLTLSERTRVDTYLAIKYGTTLSGGSMNYLDSTGSILWNATTNAGYKNNITVIGRDDASALSQKQSK